MSRPIASSSSAFLDRERPYAVEFARGDDALAACDAQPPDLVLLDMLMPGLDGFETVQRSSSAPASFCPSSW
jgi:CheY-like chemotaxis protein